MPPENVGRGEIHSLRVGIRASRRRGGESQACHLETRLSQCETNLASFSAWQLSNLLILNSMMGDS